MAAAIPPIAAFGVSDVDVSANSEHLETITRYVQIYQTFAYALSSHDQTLFIRMVKVQKCFMNTNKQSGKTITVNKIYRKIRPRDTSRPWNEENIRLVYWLLLCASTTKRILLERPAHLMQQKGVTDPVPNIAEYKKHHTTGLTDYILPKIPEIAAGWNKEPLLKRPTPGQEQGAEAGEVKEEACDTDGEKMKAISEVDQKRQDAAQCRQAEEEARKTAEQQKTEETERQESERKAAEKQKAEEEAKKAAETTRKQEEERKEAEKRKAEGDAKELAEEAQRQEDERKAAQQRKAEEAQNLRDAQFAQFRADVLKAKEQARKFNELPRKQNHNGEQRQSKIETKVSSNGSTGVLQDSLPMRAFKRVMSWGGYFAAKSDSEALLPAANSETESPVRLVQLPQPIDAWAYHTPNAPIHRLSPRSSESNIDEHSAAALRRELVYAFNDENKARKRTHAAFTNFMAFHQNRENKRAKQFHSHTPTLSELPGNIALELQQESKRIKNDIRKELEAELKILEADKSRGTDASVGDRVEAEFNRRLPALMETMTKELEDKWKARMKEKIMHTL